jgi:hypothetical protein
MSERRIPQRFILCGRLTLAVVALDTVTPKGYAETVLYAVVVFVALPSASVRLIAGFSAFCTVLTVVGFFASPSADSTVVLRSVVIRTIAVLMIVTTAAIGFQRRALYLERQRLLAEREGLLTQALSGFIPVCAWCKKVRAEKEAWQSLEAYVRERTAAKFTHVMCQVCYKEHLGEVTPPPADDVNSARTSTPPAGASDRPPAPVASRSARRLYCYLPPPAHRPAEVPTPCAASPSSWPPSWPGSSPSPPTSPGSRSRNNRRRTGPSPRRPSGRRAPPRPNP